MSEPDDPMEVSRRVLIYHLAMAVGEGDDAEYDRILVAYRRHGEIDELLATAVKGFVMQVRRRFPERWLEELNLASLAFQMQLAGDIVIAEKEVPDGDG